METITGLSVETMSGGALIERFDAELRKAVENILDVNTSEKKKPQGYMQHNYYSFGP